MRTLIFFSLLFIASDAPNLSASVIQLTCAALIACAVFINQSKEVTQ
jgi:cell division protein FtsW (lipid II flippase)